MSTTPPQTPERSPRTPRRRSSTPRRRRRPSSSRSRVSTSRRRRSLGNISPPSPPRFNNRLNFEVSDDDEDTSTPQVYGLPGKLDPATYASGLSFYNRAVEAGHLAMPRRPGAFYAQAENPEGQARMREQTLRDRALPFDDELARAFVDQSREEDQVASIPYQMQAAVAVPYYGAPPPSQFRAQAYAVTDEDVKDLQQAPSYWLDDDNAPITAEAWAVFGKMVKRGLRILKSHHKKGKESKKSLIKQLKSQKMPKNRFGLRKFYIKYVESL